MSGIIINQNWLLKRALPLVCRRLVSTSNKKCETATAEISKVEAKSETQRSWVSYGFDIKNKEADRSAMHSYMFVAVSLCLVVGGVYWMYLPDMNLRDWAQREAFLELHRREQKGLLPIDPNYINPANINLPSDEELGDTEIII